MPGREIHLLVCGVLLLSLACSIAHGATVQGMYEATVPLADRSERAQAEAFQAAMKQVLVRVTGRREAAEEPALAALVNEPRQYLQQFRVVGGNQLYAGFDGPKVERAVREAGQQIWGHERPATLAVVVDESGRRIVQAGDSSSPARAAVARGAALRGLPLVWPDASRPVDLADTSLERVQSLRESYDADAVLVGRMMRGGQVRWTLLQSSEPTEWVGSLEEGPHGAADSFAGMFAVDAADPAGAETDVQITVTGIGGVRDYASVTSYLESLTLVRGLAVDQLAGDTVVYRARVQGDSDRLARAIALGQRLVASPDVGPGEVGPGEVGPGEVGPGEVGPGKVGNESLHFRLRQ
jgi:uncharacterized protein